MYQRALGEEMFKDFQEGGPLHELLTYVQNDDTLDLEFRGDHAANIYYRGGSLFRIDRSVGVIFSRLIRSTVLHVMRRWGQLLRFVQQSGLSRFIST